MWGGDGPIFSCVSEKMVINNMALEQSARRVKRFGAGLSGKLALALGQLGLVLGLLPSTVTTLPYHQVIGHPNAAADRGIFKGKAVFIGYLPTTWRDYEAILDDYHTVYSRADGLRRPAPQALQILHLHHYA